MADNKRPLIYWLLPSIPDVIFITILLLIIVGIAGDPLGDADTGYHIRTGEYIMENLEVPEHDIFSHISPPIKWTSHEWLSEVVFALIHKVSGLTGIFVVSAVLIALVYFLLMKFLRAAGISVIVAALLVALTAGASAIHWLARPHIFSLLLMLVWYMIIDAYQLRNRNSLYLLPLLTLIWVNLHAGFIAGLMLLLIYIIGNLLKTISTGEAADEAKTKLRKFLFVSALCVFASLINPHGFEILLFPFKLTGQRFIMDNVQEWLSPNFHKILIYEYMLLLMILVFWASIPRLTAIEVMLIMLFTHMSLYSARYIPIYALVASPIIGRHIDHIIHDLGNRKFTRKFLTISDNIGRADSMARGHLWPFLAVAAVVFLVFTGKIEYGFDRERHPVDAVEFMKKEKLPGNMFNNDEFGDYIIYAAWPDYRVFFDGRNDMYGSDRLEEYVKVTRVKPGGGSVFKKYNINWIIDNAGSSLSVFLSENDNWRLIYADSVAYIFLRNTAENRTLIEKYGLAFR